ncbi:ATP-binding cassette domain-containing protein [Bifidobacterium bombi]|uniref:ABC transporter, ATP-binding protein n=1 Tax=Bifidobacterium bombi DSM 19703 TaxID=1341695 RepID=A0A080N2W2_9BIFI|nr:ATP-binding cassette domain-containing protein [Bifidobacterium bombi]KFF31372.1 ABC transporter, ATP-binding protein [Bifidobacterium bombi DSM 19703]
MNPNGNDNKLTKTTDNIEDIRYSIVYDDEGKLDITSDDTVESGAREDDIHLPEANSVMGEKESDEHTSSQAVRNLDVFADTQLYGNLSGDLDAQSDQDESDEPGDDSEDTVGRTQANGHKNETDVIDYVHEREEDEEGFSQAASLLLRSYPAMSFDHVTSINHKTGRRVLDDLQLTFEEGTFYALKNADDEQRRAFLQVATGFRVPDSGQVMLKSAGLIDLGDNEIRGHRIGLITQRYSIWPELDAIGNIERTMKSSGRTFLEPIPEIAHRLLKTVGFDQAVTGLPLRQASELNLRRACIARAVCCDANVIIADDPTGGLKDDEQEAVLLSLAQIAHAKDPKRCVIILTDDPIDIDTADETRSFER